MNLNKCERCGCFFVSSNCVCPSCQAKDDNEISKLKSFFHENEIPGSVEDLAISTGITMKNLNRFLENKDFLDITKKLGIKPNGNISTNL